MRLYALAGVPRLGVARAFMPEVVRSRAGSRPAAHTLERCASRRAVPSSQASCPQRIWDSALKTTGTRSTTPRTEASPASTRARSRPATGRPGFSGSVSVGCDRARCWPATAASARDRRHRAERCPSKISARTGPSASRSAAGSRSRRRPGRAALRRQRNGVAGHVAGSGPNSLRCANTMGAEAKSRVP
jgi:hypothetical protein